jgi:3-oxoadipate enol-lactonase
MPATLGYDTYGPPDAPVVVLGSALGTNASVWRDLTETLATSRRVIVYEHRGHGRSDLPAGPHHISDLGGDVLAMLDRLRVNRFSFVGTSLGGMVGQWLAAARPDRVERLGLVCTAAHLPPAQSWWDRAALVRSDGTKALSGLLAGKWFTDDFRATNPATVAEVLGEVESTAAEGYAACCEAVATMDLRPLLPRITAPTLAVAADQDPSTPPDLVRDMAERIPAAGYQVVPGVRHLAALERADVITPIVARHLGVG